MATESKDPPVSGETRQARNFVKACGQDSPQTTPPEFGLKFTRRRAAGLEPLMVILDDLAERGLPICTATTEAMP